MREEEELRSSSPGGRTKGGRNSRVSRCFDQGGTTSRAVLSPLAELVPAPGGGGRGGEVWWQQPGSRTGSWSLGWGGRGDPSCSAAPLKLTSPKKRGFCPAGEPERLPQPDGGPLGRGEEQRHRGAGAGQHRLHRTQNQFGKRASVVLSGLTSSRSWSRSQKLSSRLLFPSRSTCPTTMGPPLRKSPTDSGCRGTTPARRAWPSSPSSTTALPTTSGSVPAAAGWR